MVETPGLRIPTDVCEIDDAFVQSSYASAMRFLRNNYSYIFNGPEGSTDKLLISTWSKKVRRSHVLKHGTTQDIDTFATATPRNSPKRRGIEQSARVHRKKGSALSRGPISG